MSSHPDTDHLTEAVAEKWSSEKVKKETTEHIEACPVCAGIVSRERARLRKAGVLK